MNCESSVFPAKHFRSTIFTLSILFVMAVRLSAQDASEILKKAGQTMRGFTTFRANITSETKIQGKSSITISQRTDPDGFQEVRTEASTNTPGAASVTIQNRDGMWMIFGKYAINMKYQQAATKASMTKFASLPTLDDSGSKFDISEEVFQNIPCYVIKETLSEKYKSASAEAVNTPEMQNLMKQGGITIKDVPAPAVNFYKIGKNDFIIYSQESYDDGGDMISRIQYTNVETGMPLADELFQIPQNLTRLTANSLEEFMTLLPKAMQ